MQRDVEEQDDELEDGEDETGWQYASDNDNPTVPVEDDDDDSDYDE